MNAKMFRCLLCIVSSVVLSTWSARANVYATDIKLNGSLTNANSSIGSPVSITYRLNQTADLGVTVSVLQGTNVVAAISGGTNMGLNSVSWTPAVGGTYAVRITAAATGFPIWTQISVDSNAGNYAFYPAGMAVDNNTNSPYYGRVVLGCGFANGTAANPISGTIIQDGIYKMNADGSFADEGGFGYGGYTKDDLGDVASGEMPANSKVVPYRLRIGEDDRIYMLDFSDEGAIVAFDMQVAGFQIVIDDGGFAGGTLGGPHNYAGNPDFADLYNGIGNFDVTSTTTSNAAVWLCNNDYPNNWGIWMYHLVNGQSDTNDTGTQAVYAGTNSDLSLASSGGCTVDNNLDIFCGQSRVHEDAVYDAMVFTNWDGGILPPISSGFSFAKGTNVGEVEWGYGCGVDTTCTNDPTFETVQDVVINSRTSPTIVACPMAAGDLSANGIRLLNATNGSIVLANLDFGQQYLCAAWDNVGNLYGASSTRNVWRAWSPPGTNTNTAVAVAQVIVTVPFKIGSITAVPTGSGCANVTINFTAPGNLAASAFTLVGSTTVKGTYSAVSGAVITGGSGSYQAAFSNCSTEFYKLEHP
jgi:hypothetical protein